jgi:hypothetical protein
MEHRIRIYTERDRLVLVWLRLRVGGLAFARHGGPRRVAESPSAP